MKKSEYEDIIVNDSHIKLKAILFFAVVIIAIAAFAYGFTRMGHKDPGLYEIETLPDEEANNYSYGYKLELYFDGKSSEIKDNLNRAKEVYSSSLLRAYKLLDESKTYTGFVNVASLNQNPGEVVSIPSELYEVLCDANEKTSRNMGYSMFRGPLYSHLKSINVLANPEEFDPIVNQDEAERLNRIDELLKSYPAELIIADADSYSVSFNLQKELINRLEDEEESTDVLNLGEMKDAYILNIVRNSLEKEGFNTGYLVSDSGIVLTLSGHSGGEYCLYGFDNTAGDYTEAESKEEYADYITRIGTIQLEPNMACAGIRNFAFEKNERYYYSVKAEGKLYKRSQFYNMDDAQNAFISDIDSAYSVSFDGDVAEAVFSTVYVNTNGTASGALEKVGNILIAYTSSNGDGRKMELSGVGTNKISYYK